jgi:myo-inositol-1-phosphate synthase
VIDAVRCAKLAKNHGIGGSLLGPSAYFMKSPAIQYTDEQARQLTEEFIVQYSAHPSAPQAPKGNGHRESEVAAVQELPVAE